MISSIETSFKVQCIYRIQVCSGFGLDNMFHCNVLEVMKREKQNVLRNEINPNHTHNEN